MSSVPKTTRNIGINRLKPPVGVLTAKPPGELKMKARSVSRKRLDEPISISYLGRARVPSEGDLTDPGTSTPTVRTRPTTRSRTASTVRKPETSFGAFGALIKETDEVGALAKTENFRVRKVKMLLDLRLGAISTNHPDEQLVLTAARLLNKKNDWSLNTCHAYITTIVDNITSVEDRNREIALESVEAIAIGLPERLVQFATVNHHHRIGTDVAAEERAKKAKFCIKQLQEMVQKRDVYYKELDEKSIERLDMCMELLKNI